MSYGFRELKTVTVADGEVALRIPRCWGVWPHKERNGYWGCYGEGDADIGTLWIQVDHSIQPGTSVPYLTRGIVEKMEIAGTPAPLVEHTITPVDHGYLSRRVYDVGEDDEPLRFWFSRFYLERGGHGAIISINFVLTKAQMDQPEFVELRAIVDREVRGAFLDPFRHDEENDAEETFGPLGICNFDNGVKLVLPEAMGCWPDGGADGTAQHQWYCRLETGRGRPHVGMFVIVADYPADEEEDLDVRTIMQDGFGDPASAPLPLSQEYGYVQRTPWGAVLYEVIDDDPTADVVDDPPLSNHLWTYVCRDEDRHRRMRVLLMIPQAEAAMPPFPQFLAYIDRAVWRAEFPGVEVVAG